MPENGCSSKRDFLSEVRVGASEDGSPRGFSGPERASFDHYPC